MKGHKTLEATRYVAPVVSHPDLSKTDVSTTVAKQAAGWYRT
jgi:hypothetical protein